MWKETLQQEQIEGKLFSRKLKGLMLVITCYMTQYTGYEFIYSWKTAVLCVLSRDF